MNGTQPVLLVLWPLRSKTFSRNSLMIQWLRLGALTAMGWGSIPGQGTKIPQAVGYGQKEKKKRFFSANLSFYILELVDSLSSELSNSNIPLLPDTHILPSSLFFQLLLPSLPTGLNGPLIQTIIVLRTGNKVVNKTGQTSVLVGLLIAYILPNPFLSYLTWISRPSIPKTLLTMLLKTRPLYFYPPPTSGKIITLHEPNVCLFCDLWLVNLV